MTGEKQFIGEYDVAGEEAETTFGGDSRCNLSRSTGEREDERDVPRLFINLGEKKWSA